MVRPPKVLDVDKQQNKDFQKITRKNTAKNVSPEVEEKYRSFPTKSGDKKKQFRKMTEFSEVNVSSTPPSIYKPEITPKMAVRIDKKSSLQLHSNFTKRQPIKNQNTTQKNAKRTSSDKAQKSRPIPSKNKIPVIAKSEPMKRMNRQDNIRRQKFSKNKSNSSPPPENFKAEGKKMSQPKTKLITPHLISSRLDKLQQDLNNKIAINKVTDHSNASLLKAHYSIGHRNDNKLPKKTAPKKLRKTTKMPVKKIKKAPSKNELRKRVENLDRKSSEEKIIREIKHNDSFVISARKLQSATRCPKKNKPEVIRLFKRRDVKKIDLNNNPLKSCLKKNSDGNPKQNFGENTNKLLPKKLKSQVPRSEQEQTVK